MSDTPDRPTPQVDPNNPNLALVAMVAGLATRVGELVSSITELGSRLEARPTRAENLWKARRNLLGVVALILGIAFLSDQHTEQCGPGHRSEPIVELVREAIRDGKRLDPEELAEAIDSATPGWVCGVTFPLHSHNGDPWPQGQHIAGMAIYVGVFGALAAWVYRPYRRHQEEQE